MWTKVAISVARALVRFVYTISLTHFYSCHLIIEDNNDSVVFAAAPDIGWPDCFNSGVMVLRPDMRIFHRLMEKARTPDCSFDGKKGGLSGLGEYIHIFFSLSRWRSRSP